MIIELKPISINASFRGRRFKTKECKDFENDFMLLAPKQKMIKGNVEVEYRFYLKNCKMIDWDNCCKVMQDLLVKCGYIEDDRKIYKATVYKIQNTKDYMDIKIKKLRKDYL